MKTSVISIFIILYFCISFPAMAQDGTSQPQSVIESARSIVPNMKPNPTIAEGYINNDAIKDTVLLVRYDKADYYDKTNIREVKKILIISNDKGDKNKPYYYAYPLIALSQEWNSEPNRAESIWIKDSSLYLQESVRYDSGTYTTIYQFKMDGYRLTLTGLEYKASSSIAGKQENVKMDFDANKIRLDEFNPDAIYRIIGLKSAIVSDYTTHIKDFHSIYTGKIGEKYAVTMYLEKNGKEITGTYKYAGQTTPLALKGSIASSGEFTMNESPGGKKITGIFSGKISGTTITGKWNSPDNVKKLDFAAHIPSKREMLQNAAGKTYYLSYISGAVGANTLFDTYMENGVWKSHSSSISGGMREGQEDTLSSDDIKLLNSMYIKVDTDLTVRFFAGGKLLLEVPFNEAGMDYHMSGERKDVFSFSQGKLSPSTTFMDGKLYLAAIDGIDYSDTISSGNFIIIGKDKVILSYDPYDSFGMDISEIYGNTLTFTKK